MAKLEFSMLQALYFVSFNNLSNVDNKMEAENRNQFEKSMGRNEQPKEGIKKKIPTSFQCVI